MRKLLKIFRRPRLFPVELWDDINQMWLHNWEQLNLTGDTKWLIVDPKDRNRKVRAERLEQAFFRIHDQYAELSGNSETMDKYRILCIALIEARVMLATDRSMKNYIRMYEEQIAALMNSDGDQNIIKDRMIIQKHYGQRINPHKTTVAEYLNIIQVVNEMAAQSKGKDGAD